jgi:hypothetical protein
MKVPREVTAHKIAFGCTKKPYGNASASVAKKVYENAYTSMAI